MNIFRFANRGLGAPLASSVAHDKHRPRSAFTLIELLVAISIIGILASLALGGMYRANIAAKRTNSKTTISKIGVQINEIWDSYRTRKLPIDPKLILQSNGNPPYQIQNAAAVAWLKYYAQVHNTSGISTSTFYPDPQAAAGYNGVNPNNTLQLAAVRLAAIHELMRLELPFRFLDFTDNPSAINSPITGTHINSGSVPPVTTLLIPQPYGGTPAAPIANPGGLSEQYRQFFLANYNAVAVPYDPKASLYEPAECLYMIIKFASQNELGQKNITDDPRLVGDADGDGMPEIQDAFNATIFTPPAAGSPFTQHNYPISFVRWPLGFVSDLQPQPTLLAPSSFPYNFHQPYNYEYAGQRHEIFDPLRIDPRAVALTPLVCSAGPDTDVGIFDYVSGYSNPLSQVIWDDVAGSSPIGATALPLIMNDPYYIGLPTLPGFGLQLTPSTLPMAGTGTYADNITNHVNSTRSE